MKRTLLAFALVATFSAQAQFVDERSAPPTAAAPGSAPGMVVLPGATTPTAAPAAAAAAAAPRPKEWRIQSTDLRLADALKRWAADAGYQLRWDAERHVQVGGDDSFTDDFESAVVDALSTPGILYSEYPLEVCFYPNTPRLARVTRQGVQGQYCSPMAERRAAAAR